MSSWKYVNFLKIILLLRFLDLIVIIENIKTVIMITKLLDPETSSG